MTITNFTNAAGFSLQDFKAKIIFSNNNVQNDDYTIVYDAGNVTQSALRELISANNDTLIRAYLSKENELVQKINTNNFITQIKGLKNFDLIVDGEPTISFPYYINTFKSDIANMLTDDQYLFYIGDTVLFVIKLVISIDSTQTYYIAYRATVV